MKYLIIAALCSFLVLEAVADRHPKLPRGTRPPRPPKPQKCDTSADCQEWECCVGDPKKFFKKAECRKLEVAGNRCSEEDAHFKGRYLLRCPCVEGLNCEAKQVLDTKKGGKLRFNARCIDPNATEGPEPVTDEPEPETEGPDSSSSESKESAE